MSRSSLSLGAAHSIGRRIHLVSLVVHSRWYFSTTISVNNKTVKNTEKITHCITVVHHFQHPYNTRYQLLTIFTRPSSFSFLFFSMQFAAQICLSTEIICGVTGYYLRIIFIIKLVFVFGLFSVNICLFSKYLSKHPSSCCCLDKRSNLHYLGLCDYFLPTRRVSINKSRQLDNKSINH